MPYIEPQNTEAAVMGLISSGLTEKATDLKKAARLKEMLEDEKFTWRSFDRLRESIDAGANKTRDLLAKIGARESRSSRDVEIWGLVSRVGPEPPLESFLRRKLTSPQFKEILRQSAPDVEDAE